MNINKYLIKNMSDFNVLNISNSSSNRSVQSVAFVALAAGQTMTLNIKKGNLVAFVLNVGGLWNNNAGYGINFDIAIDGIVNKSNSGFQSISPADWGNLWSTNGTNRVFASLLFLFKNITPGNHTFQIVWSSTNAGVTAKIGQYGTTKLIGFEIT